MRKKIFLQLILVGLMLLGYQQVFAINKPPSCSSTPTQGSKTSSVAHGHCLTHHPRTSVKGSSRRSARTKGSRVKKPLPTADHLLRTAIRSSSTLNPRLRLRQARRGVRAT
ncbi:MAG: hypothetical protein K0U29_07955, partial [Gammaproteobacteria bacterium]|nr:hypothetical protein [Gammaproteobacteria bacterium]